MSGPAVSLRNDGGAAMRRVLDRSYWVVCLAFCLVVAAFTRDRVCADHLNLLPAVASRPPLAWAVAAAYMSGYCWVVAAYAATVRATGTLLPDMVAVTNVWSRPWRFGVLAAGFVLDYLPPALLRVGAGLCG